MWTIPGLLGLVLMLLASAETKSRKLQSLTSDTAARIFNNTEILQEVNTGSAHIIPILKVVISENYCSKEFLSILLQTRLIFFKSIIYIFHRMFMMQKKDYLDLTRKLLKPFLNCKFTKIILFALRI